jgi:hypothetical protein
MPNVEIYLSNDTTLATAIPISADIGSESAETELHVWYSKGTAGGAAKTLRLMVAAESQSAPGTLVYSGVAPLDRGWLKVRASGIVNPGSVAGVEPQSTGWYPVSSGAPFSLVSIPGNVARVIFVKLATPLDVGVASETWNLYLVPVWEDVVTPLPLGLRGLGGGILSGIGDATVTESVALAAITPSGTPDAFVHYAGVQMLVNGVPAAPVDGSFELDQNDVNAAALVSGEAYIAVAIVYADASVAVLKGAKAASGSALAPDPAALTSAPFAFACQVEVAYGAAGSVIGAGAITNRTRDARFKITAGTGLAARMAPGRAVLPGVFVERSDAVDIVLSPSVDTWTWLETDGTAAKTTTATPPHVGALPTAKVTTDAGAVTAIVDLRPIVNSPFNSAPYSLPGSVAVVDDVDFGGHAILNAKLGSALDAQSFEATNLWLGAGTKFTAEIEGNYQHVKRLSTPLPADAGDAATVEFVQRRVMKDPCAVIATADLTLSGEQTVDGVALVDGDVCLAAGQTTVGDRGKYFVRTGAWNRHYDCFDTYTCYPGILVVVLGGTARGLYVQTGAFASQTWVLLVALP